MLKNSKLLPIDIISYAYIIFNLIYILLGRNRIENAGFHLLIFANIALILFLIITFHKPGGNIVLSFLRHWYPLILVAYYFSVSTIVCRVVFPEYLDPYFQYIDKRIFGYQPAIEWGKWYNNTIIQEIFYFAYFSYYLIVPGVAFLICFKKREYFQKYIFTISFVYYVCFFTYSILPVVGGRYWDDIFQLAMTSRGGIFPGIMAFIYTNSQHKGAAFPSSHVAIMVVVNMATFKYSARLGKALMPLTILLTVATVYCHYHYVVDTLFGIIYAFIFFLLGEKLYDYLMELKTSSRYEVNLEAGKK